MNESVQYSRLCYASRPLNIYVYIIRPDIRTTVCGKTHKVDMVIKKVNFHKSLILKTMTTDITLSIASSFSWTTEQISTQQTIQGNEKAIRYMYVYLTTQSVDQVLKPQLNN